MSTPIAELELSGSAASPDTQELAVVDDGRYPERPFGVARGIINAVLIATPFWMLFAVVLYLLI